MFKADHGRFPLRVAGRLRKQTSDVLLLDVRSLGRRIGAFDPKRSVVSMTSLPGSSRSTRAYENAVSHARAALGDPQFVDESNAGSRLTREQAIALALAE